ncbi:MAG: LytTR family DNA-binding domain-containing protein [Bacteroidota bacterium]
MRYKTIIVDDEKDAREGISLLLQQDDTIHITAICADGFSAIQAIEQHKPDILFLDIQMPEVNGFEVLRSVDYTPKAVVFVTAYDDFALKAFEVRAIDYLLKPFSDSRFRKSLKYAKERVNSKSTLKTSALLDDVKRTSSSPAELIEKPSADILIVKDKGKVHLINYKDIRWLEAYDYYVKIHLKSHLFLLRESLKKLEAKLQPFGFIRVHKSALVNSRYISSVEPVSTKEFKLNLKEGHQVKVSRNYKNSLFDYLKASK